MFGTSKRFPDKKGKRLQHDTDSAQPSPINYDSKLSRNDSNRKYKPMGQSERFKDREDSSNTIIPPVDENTPDHRGSRLLASSTRKPSTVGVGKAEYMSLQRELKHLQERMNKEAMEHERSLAEIRGRLGRAKADLVGMAEEKRGLEAQCKRVEGDLKETNHRLSHFKAQVEEGKRASQEAQASGKDHLGRVRELERTVEGMRDKIRSLRTERDHLIMKGKGATDALANLSRARELLGEEQEKTAFLEGRVRQMSKDTQRLQDALDSLQEVEKHQNMATEEEAAAYLHQVQQLQDSLAALAQEKERTEEEARVKEKSMREEMDHLHSLLRAQHDQHKAKVEALERRMSAPSPKRTLAPRMDQKVGEDEKKEQEQELSMLRGLVQVLEKDQTRLTQLLQGRTREAENAHKTAKEEVDSCKEEARMVTSLLESRANMAMAEVRQLRSDLEVMSGEVKELRDRSGKDRIQALLDRERLMRDHASTIASLERAGAEVAQRIRQGGPDRTGRIRELEGEVARCKKELEQLRAQTHQRTGPSQDGDTEAKGFEARKRSRGLEAMDVGHSQPQTHARVEALSRELEKLKATSDSSHAQHLQELERLKGDLYRMSKENSGLKDLLREQAEERAEAQEHLELQTEFIRSQHPLVAEELSRASDGVLANPSTRLRIKHLNRLKDDLLSMKEDNASLHRQVEDEQGRADRAERELMAFKSIGPSTTTATTTIQEGTKVKRYRMHKIGASGH
ncbi:hypothetical protein BJ684DRAFT_18504 [Piptocephalis cylindrospora]|uniref:Hyaluronan-mediated motility receptor C-terminal domain-containing protein n=1 Tax=Piptocephalis cylindrospora TaxID=1907219 RepID=A0A4P9Y8M6_9FUNG|nr:hypothetical protein BJ684DRAFT_18504 [Piptocephalis cylindrospora]|eukprot:RKP15154.1 hypothetical protein BJ684DRAFT_18504 [Piptocephalis cylindrospora]